MKEKELQQQIEDLKARMGVMQAEIDALRILVYSRPSYQPPPSSAPKWPNWDAVRRGDTAGNRWPLFTEATGS